MTTHGLLKNACHALLALTVSAGAHAALTDIASVPLNTYNAPSSSNVKPNIMYVLDNSGSMAWDYMPDTVGNWSNGYGQYSSQCNGVYYNPSITYTPPVNSAGTPYTNASFTAAWIDGYKTSSGTYNLSNNFDGMGVAAYYYKYTGTQTTARLQNYNNSNSTFYKECGSSIGSTPGSNVFTKVTVGASEQQNFANWYSYYRTRILMTKTALGQAFGATNPTTGAPLINDSFRVGFMTINSTSGTDFLNVADFTTANKSTWYSALYAVQPSGSTPLRTALSEAGRMYANKISSINGTTVTDPVQYSCQQNYAILSTDGFWNTGLGYKLDGATEIGNEDAALPRPYFDGGTSTVQMRTSNLQQQTSQLQSQTSTLQGTLSKVLMQCNNTSAVCGSAPTTGVANGNWSIVTSGSCTPATNVQCAIVSGLSGTSAVAGSCNTAATITTPAAPSTPSHTMSGYISDNSHKMALGLSASNPDSTNSHCVQLGGTGANTAWFCRGSGSSNPVVSSSSATDSTGKTWYLVSSVSGNTGCTTDNTAWGSGYSSSYGACPGTAGGTSYTLNNADSNGKIYSNCAYTSGAPAGTSSCTQVNQSGTPNNTSVVTAQQCNTVVTSPYATVNSCTASSTPDGSGYTTQCQYSSWSSWSTVTTGCTAVSQSSGPNYTGPAIGCQTTTSGGSTDSLADVAAYYYNTDLRDSTLSNCTGPVIAPATTANDLCANNVPSNGRDVASWQHMTTFTVGLGTRGNMVFSPTYWTDTSGDFWDVWKGTTANPNAAPYAICSWQTSGVCNWPPPDYSSSGGISNVDDLWHTAVNGHGSYYAATDPSGLAQGLSNLLTTIINTPRPGTAAAAASSNPNISSSDNYVFSSSYKSVEWYGELIRQQIDASTGTLSAQQWSAMSLLDTKVQTDFTTRNIYTNVSGALTAFRWGNLTSAQQGYFKAPYLTYTSATAGLSQFCTTGGNCLSGTAQSNTTVATSGAAGENLINFLRGDRTNEGSFYRARTHVLGDIVSSEARYVKAPSFSYGDAGYSAFKTAQASRTGIVYVAANDGMLHAFNATSGNETWAYIPSFVLPNLYKLADMNYSTQHQFFVDGSPEVGDINAGGWKTILVGGLNDGGKGYYALDITDPANPSLLWEYTNANMGSTYGDPRIVKLADGTWVVIVTSGYNNADGLGHLYVLNANSGTLIRDIPTSAGSATTPSGLARISARVVSSSTDNTVKAVYGGDLLGNLWRFDVNGNIGAAGYDAQLLVSLKDASGNAQPITAKPTTATVNGNAVVYVGTGIYLGVSDVSSTSQQTFYAVKDKLDTTTYGNPRIAASNFVAQTLTNTTCPSDAPSTVCTPGQTIRGISGASCQAMDWSSKNGWYVDFLTGGERSTTDSALGLGTLIFTTNIPNQASASACGTSTGTDTSASFAYALDYQTGCSVPGSAGVAGGSLGSGEATRGILGRLADGSVIEIIRTSGGNSSGGGGTDLGGTTILKPTINNPGGPAKRVSWRELITE